MSERWAEHHLHVGRGLGTEWGDPRSGPGSATWELWGPGPALSLSGLICKMGGMNQNPLKSASDCHGLGQQSGKAWNEADHMFDGEPGNATSRYITQEKHLLMSTERLVQEYLSVTSPVGARNWELPKCPSGVKWIH